MFGEKLNGRDPQDEASGFIHEDRLWELLNTMGDSFTNEEVDEMYREAPNDKKGKFGGEAQSGSGRMSWRLRRRGQEFKANQPQQPYKLSLIGKKKKEGQVQLGGVHPHPQTWLQGQRRLGHPNPPTAPYSHRVPAPSGKIRPREVKCRTEVDVHIVTLEPWAGVSEPSKERPPSEEMGQRAGPGGNEGRPPREPIPWLLPKEEGTLSHGIQYHFTCIPTQTQVHPSSLSEDRTPPLHPVRPPVHTHPERPPTLGLCSRRYLLRGGQNLQQWAED
ncbi:hypothetical protein P7K49_019268 [Saguinus oedipus]|uniref:Uncharacterized protein n=1 Tax=Saguinus oedipus TaxID=9490 RepID=A0ABQ9UZE5_SAGOE|nr:hypothetical protein P7K49_019268 [Saguinus oedipus]